MATDKNTPKTQEAAQVSEAMNNEEDDLQPTQTNFNQEYETAQQNETGAGNQSSDPNPVNREPAEAGVADAKQAGNTPADSGKSGSSSANSDDTPHSPPGGESNPAEYLDMAKETTDS
ncbi:hypothetical protein IQ241_21010 [Romeria aff. gracilis LEGE 07310]|uniref:Uncharacterized protein n=1 Tax=Vasconcelosia minhoensis LEGE 07310 TaxID=915328 RepID=A0A8J7AS86_9CYAN|nr:hypothetical protein [Romeria gracilis]MBE9079741.1 hypothetical protein [Romeria aff. gracilis LEGE 07310]